MCPFFFGKRVTHYPRKKELHTKISHSHRLAAEDGQKSASIQRRVKSVDLKKNVCESVRGVWKGVTSVTDWSI